MKKGFFLCKTACEKLLSLIACSVQKGSDLSETQHVIVSCNKTDLHAVEAFHSQNFQNVLKKKTDNRKGRENYFSISLNKNMEQQTLTTKH